MNRASRYLANVIVLRSFRVALVTILTCICHHVTLTDGKLFERCELAQVLRYGHGVDVNDVANWVCIAQHSSSLNTSAFGGNAKSGSHGLFQISDEYWCSPPGKGVGCGLSCNRLRDDDIKDDLNCVQKIHDEHQRLSGDGYNAWRAYELYCKENPYEYIEDCFGNEEQEYIRSKSITTNYVEDEDKESDDPQSRGKVYGRCELAKELFLKHKMPMEEIPTWVCIAQHESRYDTAAVGRLNADGSADHGLFQISDLFWCSKTDSRRKACGVPCSKFLDSDITDDVKCVKQIYKEHTKISGDGFNAWTVYKQHCQGTNEKYIRGCFDGVDFVESKSSEQYREYAKPSKVDKKKTHGKVYEACELADDLRNKYHLPEDQIATWVCIAKHESGYNTSAIGYGDHGLFQISDIYWCSPPGKGWACGLSCSDLEDSDISDDVYCVRKIYDEHSHLSGDGFNAWTVYPRYCSNGRSEKYISHCSASKESLRTAASYNSYSKSISLNSIESYKPPVEKGKIYARCELADELLNKYHMPMEEISTWVCIAHHESNFDTSAVGRLNADGSADHGLFQISDLFWCSDEEDGYGKACGLPCSKLLDSDISDDVECVKQIHEEHTRISGDGFNAWTVYNAYCKDRTEQYTRGCFDGSAFVEDFEPIKRINELSFVPKNKPKGKVYEDCELAKELRDKHRIPKDQISSWVCIAKHQSGLNTSASAAGSHGMFFISDEFWCSPPGKGKACELHCSDLEDSDITDDVQCVSRIYDEHQRIFGNGFNAWRVYDQYCSNGKADFYTNHCQGFESTARNSITYGGQENQYKFGGRSLDVSKPVFNHAFNANPFLKHIDAPNLNSVTKSYPNPFLKTMPSANPYQYVGGESFSASESVASINHEYMKNPFLKYVQSVTQKPTVKSIQTTTALPISLWGNQFTTSSTASYSFFKKSSTPPTKSATKSFSWSTPPVVHTFKVYPTMTEEKAKYEFFKTLTTPSPPAFTVTPKANRLQPYHLNTFKPFETTITPFWLASTTAKPVWITPTTSKPTNRFQFYEPSTQKITTKSPFWLTTTTPKPTQKTVAATQFWLTSTTPKPTNRFQFYEPSTQKPTTKTPFWLTTTTARSTLKTVAATQFWSTSTTPKPTNRLQFYESSTQKSNTKTPFWLTTTTAKPTLKTVAATPFWLTSTTPKPTNRFQFYDSSTTKTQFWLTSSTTKPSTQKSTTKTPFWLTTTTSKPTSRFQLNESSFQKSVAATPFWLTSTTPKPTSRLQMKQSSTSKSTTQTQFWLTTTTPKPTTRTNTSVSAAVPFWLTSTTPPPLSSRFTTTFTKSQWNSKLIPLAMPSIQLKGSTKPYTIKPTTKAPSQASKDSGQYNSGRYDSGKFNSGKYEAPKNALTSQKTSAKKTTTSSFGISLTTTTKAPTTRPMTTKSPWNTWSTKALSSTTSKSTKYDQFHSFPTTTINPKTTPVTTKPPTTRHPETFKTSSRKLLTTKSPWNTWSTKTFSSTTSKSTKYDPFHPFPATTVKPKTTPAVTTPKKPELSKPANSGFYVPYKPPTTVKGRTQYNPTTLNSSSNIRPKTTKTASFTGKFDPFKPFETKNGTNSPWSWTTQKSTRTRIPPSTSSLRNIPTTRSVYTNSPTKLSKTTPTSTKLISTAKPTVTSIKPSTTHSHSLFTTTKWTSKPFTYSSTKPTSTTTTKPSTKKFSVQFTNPSTKISTSTSKNTSSWTTLRPYVKSTKTQIQKSTNSPKANKLQTEIPPWAAKTTTVPPTTTVINPPKSKTSSESLSSSRNNLYDLYFKLYGVHAPNGTRKA